MNQNLTPRQWLLTVYDFVINGYDLGIYTKDFLIVAVAAIDEMLQKCEQAYES